MYSSTKKKYEEYTHFWKEMENICIFFLQEEYREKERMLAHFLIPIYTTSNHFFSEGEKKMTFSRKKIMNLCM